MARKACLRKTAALDRVSEAHTGVGHGMRPTEGLCTSSRIFRPPTRRPRLAEDRLARAYEFLDTVIVRMFGNASESFQHAAMGGREDVRFERPYTGFSRLASVAI